MRVARSAAQATLARRPLLLRSNRIQRRVVFPDVVGHQRGGTRAAGRGARHSAPTVLVVGKPLRQAKRKDIQILRGVAVLAVLLAHFGDLVPGGFLGVDVFFVISGFVITLSLLSLHETHSSAKKLLTVFWKRRFFRLVPVLVVVVAGTLLTASIALPPQQFLPQIEMAAWSLFFAGNIGAELFPGGGYFDPIIEKNWFNHLWSLGVEEQFYLVFPLIFLTGITGVWAQKSRFRALYLISTLALVSFGFSLLNSADYALGFGGIFTQGVAGALVGYYSPVSRAWQLLVGVLVALLSCQFRPRQGIFVPILGFATLLGSFWLTTESNTHPGLATLVPTLAVGLLLMWQLRDETARSPFLGPLRWLGDRSYGAYLWHWPVWLFLTSHWGHSIPVIVFAFVITILLATLSYRLIELPFIEVGRKKRNQLPDKFWASLWNPAGPNRTTRFRWLTVLTAISICFLFFSAGLEGRALNPAYERAWLSLQDEDLRATYRLVTESSSGFHNFGATEDGTQKLSDCRFRVSNLSGEIEKVLRKCGERYGPGVLVLGDSHAIDLFGMTVSKFDRKFIVGITGVGCRPHTPRPECQYEEVSKFLSSSPAVFEVVRYQQAGFYLIEKDSGVPGSRAMFSEIELGAPVTNLRVDQGHVRGTLAYLSQLAEHVPVGWVLPREAPHFTNSQILGVGCNGNFAYRPNQRELFQNLDTFIENEVSIRAASGLTTINLNQLLDLNLANDFMNCEETYWSDGDHFSTAGEVKFGAKLPPNFLD